MNFGYHFIRVCLLLVLDMESKCKNCACNPQGICSKLSTKINTFNPRYCCVIHQYIEHYGKEQLCNLWTNAYENDNGEQLLLNFQSFFSDVENFVLDCAPEHSSSNLLRQIIAGRKFNIIKSFIDHCFPKYRFINTQFVNCITNYFMLDSKCLSEFFKRSFLSPDTVIMDTPHLHDPTVITLHILTLRNLLIGKMDLIIKNTDKRFFVSIHVIQDAKIDHKRRLRQQPIMPYVGVKFRVIWDYVTRLYDKLLYGKIVFNITVNNSETLNESALIPYIISFFYVYKLHGGNVELIVDDVLSYNMPECYSTILYQPNTLASLSENCCNKLLGLNDDFVYAKEKVIQELGICCFNAGKRSFQTLNETYKLLTQHLYSSKKINPHPQKIFPHDFNDHVSSCQS